MKTNDIENKLLTITKQFLTELEAERAALAVTLQASLERELGIDSLSKVELFRRIEKAFSIRLPSDAMVEADSLYELILIMQKMTTTTSALSFSAHPTPILEEIVPQVAQVKTLTELVTYYGEHEPNRPHIYLQNDAGEEQVIGYGNLYQEAKHIAHGLISCGIQKGDTVAIMLPTSDEFFYSFFGVLLAGGIPVPIYPPFRPDRIEEYAKREAKILQNARAKVLITFEKVKFLSLMFKNFVPSLSTVTTVQQLLHAPSFKKPKVKATDIVLIQYTSGSTGDPKGVTITHDNMLANIRGIGKALGIKPGDTAVSWLPLYHDMGLMTWLNALYYGIPVTILSPLTFITRPERWLWAIHNHRATFSGAPNFGYELCIKKINPEDIEGLDLSSWRFAFNGAEAINPNTLVQFHKKFSPYGFKLETFAPVYGLAETTVGLTFPPHPRPPQVDTILRSSFEKDKIAEATTDASNTLSFVSCGLPLDDHEVRIVDDRGHVLEERNIGNIQFKGPSAMQGYYNNPAATKKVFHGGWIDTGDLGYLVNQELFITGRKKDLIIKAGRNITPEEIESIINQLPQVRRGCVIAFGVTDAKLGTEKIIVVAETSHQDQQQQNQIRALMIEKMGNELGIPPDVIVLVPPKTIPKTSSGKLQRGTCKEMYLRGQLHKPSKMVMLQWSKLLLTSFYHKIKSTVTCLGKSLYSLYLITLLCLTGPILWLFILFCHQKTSANILKRFSQFFLKLSGCKVTLSGKKNLRSSQPMIYVVNHTSYLDSVILLSILPTNVAFVGKEELLKVPLLRTFLKKLPFVAIDRMDLTKSIASKNHMISKLNEGLSILMFPEGTFTYATGLRPFKLGAFQIAVETGTPICPIALQGVRAILRGDATLPKPGKIKVTIGDVIDPKSQDWHEVTRLRSLTREEIARYCGEPIVDI